MNFAAPLAGLVGARFAKWAVYALGALLAASAIFGLYEWDKARSAAVAAAEARIEAAEAEVVRARAELELVQKNAEVSEQLVAADIVRVRTQAADARRLMEKYRHAAKPVPAGCESVLDPLRDGARVIHELRASGGDRGGAAAAGAPDHLR